MAKIMTMMSKQLLGYCICLRVKFPKTHGLRIGYCSCLEWYKNSKRVKMGSYCWQKAGVQVRYAGSESLHHLCGIRNGGHTGLLFRKDLCIFRGKCFIQQFMVCVRTFLVFMFSTTLSDGLILMSASDTQTKSTFNCYY